MPLARRTALVLALGLLVVVAFAARVEIEHRDGPTPRDADGTALTARNGGLHAATVRLERDLRRELHSPRSLKHVPLAAVFLAALLAVLAHGLRRTVVRDRVRPPVPSWWFRCGGRSPPPFQLSVI